MRRWVRILFPPGATVASAPLVFLSLSIVALFQLPANILIRGGWMMAGIAANELVAIAGAPLLLIWTTRLDRRRLLPFARPSAAVIALVVIATLGAVIAIDYGTAVSERFIPPPHRVWLLYEKLMAFSGAGAFVITFVVLCILPAICEEIYFRGFCLTSIEHRFGARAAIIITAILFALLHGNPWYFHLYFGLGLLLGWIYWATGSLWTAILCHFLNNAWTFLNHVRGFRLPLETPPGVADALLLFCSLALLFGGAWLLKKMAGRFPHPPRARS